jgi:two-component system, LytTR family, response regulator
MWTLPRISRPPLRSPGNPMTRVLIVDDEPIIRRGIRHHLARHNAYEVAGECCSGHSAIESIRHLKPDLVFLDVQMPEVDAFGVIREVGAHAMPPVVFVTAFDEHTVTALDVHALDYLLKPFDKEQFARCVARVEQRLSDETHKAGVAEKLESLIAGRDQPQKGDRIAIRNPDGITLLQADEIDWIEAADNYVEIHAGKHVHLMRETLTNLEQRLRSHRFLRIHRSKLVNTDHIEEMRPLFHGEYELVLRDGSRVTSSRHYRDVLQKLLV